MADDKVSTVIFRGTAVPSDVRKASGLPASFICNFGLRPFIGAQPQIHCDD
jgi:hypothetical protein